MTYFLTAPQRTASRSTLYFEFQKGRFKHSFWHADSIYLHADIFDRLEMHNFFSSSLPHFCYYADTQISPGQYESLKTAALACGGEIAAVFAELDIWVTACFQTEHCFTILGI